VRSIWLAGVAVLALGCSTASSSSPGVDAGKHDAHASGAESSSSVASRSSLHSSTSSTSRASADGGGDAAPHDAGADVLACTGLDAAVSGLTIRAVCENCVGAHCCLQAHGCAMTTGCKAIEECATRCVASGTTAMTCAVMCIEGDAGIPDSGLDPAQNAAEQLDLCLAAYCSGDCA
jgi:hypothetical protein